MENKILKPFNLQDALTGKAVMLRDGSKAYVRHHETELSVTNDWQLQGIREDGHLLAWALDGSIQSVEMGYVEDEIIGMHTETRVINGFEVPAPETVAPERGTAYFTPSLLSYLLHDSFEWKDYNLDSLALKRGLVFLNAEGAIANAKAMLGIDPYS